MLPSLRWRDSNPRSRMAADLQSALVAAGEHLIIFLWNLVESNHVIWIFSPAHTPSLPKFLWRRLRDSNPWGVLPPSGFQDQCNRPTLPNLLFCGSRRIRTFGALGLGTLAVCWYRPLTHTSIGFRVQRYNAPMQSFCVTRKKLQKTFRQLFIFERFSS